MSSALALFGERDCNIEIAGVGAGTRNKTVWPICRLKAKVDFELKP